MYSNTPFSKRVQWFIAAADDEAGENCWEL